MNDLRATLNGAHDPGTGPQLNLLLRLARAARSTTFVLVLLTYLVFFVGLTQRVILMPLTWIFPLSASKVLGAWARLQGRNLLRLLRVFAGVRITVEGAIGEENCIVVMNHQSMVDIPLALSLVPGPIPLFPTRRRYAWGFPGASVFIRMARLPLISQTRKDIKTDLAMIHDAAERCRNGETAFFIFPEGHRTRDGSILPFMARGITIALSRIERPVYCIVADGMWHVRTLADTMVRVAGSHIKVRILGPFQPPQEESNIPEFITFLRNRMIAALGEMRSGHPAPSCPTPPDAV